MADSTRQLCPVCGGALWLTHCQPGACRFPPPLEPEAADPPPGGATIQRRADRMARRRAQKLMEARDG